MYASQPLFDLVYVSAAFPQPSIELRHAHRFHARIVTVPNIIVYYAPNLWIFRGKLISQLHIMHASAQLRKSKENSN